MRRSLAVLVAVTSFLTVCTTAHAGPHLPPVRHDAAADWGFVERELYATPIAAFAADAASPAHDAWFDWSTDWCSAPIVGGGAKPFFVWRDMVLLPPVRRPLERNC